MLYDVLLYVTPAPRADLSSVNIVDYYLGRHWGDVVITSIHRSNGFLIVVEALGPFLCTARLKFTDGTETFQHRFIDFEMGPIGTPAAT
jgi:hypothetical protein